MSISVETSCCGKPMVALGAVDFLDRNVNQLERWLCPECGRGIDLVDYVLDEEDLKNQLEVYGQAEQSASPHVLRGGRAGSKPGSVFLRRGLQRQGSAGLSQRLSVGGTGLRRVAQRPGTERSVCKATFLIRAERRWP